MFCIAKFKKCRIFTKNLKIAKKDLDKQLPIRYNNLRRRFAPAMFAAMAQVVEHILGKDEVTSSNLVSSSIKALKRKA